MRGMFAKSASDRQGESSSSRIMIARDPRTGEPRLPGVQPTSGLFLGSHFASSPTAPTRRASEATIARPRNVALEPIVTTPIANLPGYQTSSTLPIAIPARTPIPSYDDATSPTYPSTLSTLYPASPADPSSLRTEANRLVRDNFAISPSSFRETVFEEDETDDDDPLSPRIRRPAPPPNLIPLGTRRNTMPHMYRPPTPADSESSEPQIELDTTQAILDLPPPPELPPGYSAHLAEDELRLISTVHLDQNHPAAAFFSQMTSTALSPIQATGDLPGSTEQSVEQTTGGKKLKLILTSSAERTNTNGTGPLFIRMKRGGAIEGRLEIGKADHITGLEVAILGYVNTSYYVRGQYTLIDTLPLARRQVYLWPAKPPVDGFAHSASAATRGGNAAATAPSTATAVTGPTGNSAVIGSSATTPAPSTTPGVTDTAITAATSTNHPATSIQTPDPLTASASTQTNGAPPVQAPTPATAPYQMPPVPDDGFDYANANPKTLVVGKDTFLAPDQTFHFSIQMPNAHCRLPNTELPPSAQIFQVGMQAGIEYVLRIKMSRKGWRMGETFGVPIIYEPRSYVSPRRLRVLTTNDALNPGWRTIKLNGGKPIKPVEGSDPVPDSPGVEVSLLLPSPPILFVPDGGNPPPIPFHLHFHASAILPLVSFSDPKECRFIVRFMRVATMMIGCEKEIRRMEIPSVVELWQEGGPHMILNQDPEPPKPARRPSTGAATAGPSTSATSERKRSFSDRRPSFLKRRSSVTTPATDTDPLTRAVSNVPTEPIIEEDPPVDDTPSILAPLSLGATDVHLLGQVTLKLPSSGPMHVRSLIQSFYTPEVGISYLVEVGLQPKNGAVKEAFSHVWGGGIIEVVLGHRGRR